MPRKFNHSGSLGNWFISETFKTFEIGQEWNCGYHPPTQKKRRDYRWNFMLKWTDYLTEPIRQIHLEAYRDKLFNRTILSKDLALWTLSSDNYFKRKIASDWAFFRSDIKSVLANFSTCWQELFQQIFSQAEIWVSDLTKDFWEKSCVRKNFQQNIHQWFEWFNTVIIVKCE